MKGGAGWADPARLPAPEAIENRTVPRVTMVRSVTYVPMPMPAGNSAGLSTGRQNA